MCVYNGLINVGISPKRNHMWTWKNMLKEINKQKKWEYYIQIWKEKSLATLCAYLCQDNSL